MTLYLPSDFAENDVGRLQTLMHGYPFATILTVDDGHPTVSHLPFLLDAERGDHGVLRGHMARANPQWQHFGDEPVLVVFNGPHAYVSPNWYDAGPAVPTWNYAVVHAHGVPKILDDDAALDLVRDMVAAVDGDPDAAWPDDEASDRFRRDMIAHVVAFEIPILRLEGKFKMSQNRPSVDRPRIIAALSSSDDPLEQATAKLISTD